MLTSPVLFLPAGAHTRLAYPISPALALPTCPRGKSWKNNISSTSAELSSINKIAKKSKTLEGFEHELKRINEEYQEAGRTYGSQLEKIRSTHSEIHERISPFEPTKKPEEVTPSQELPQKSKESKIKSSF